MQSKYFSFIVLKSWIKDAVKVFQLYCIKKLDLGCSQSISALLY